MAGSTGSTKWKTFNAATSTSAGKRRQATVYQQSNPNAPNYTPF